MSSIKQVRIGDITYDIDLLAQIVEERLKESSLFMTMQDLMNDVKQRTLTVIIFRTTNIVKVNAPELGIYPPNNWTINPSPIKDEDETLYISVGRMRGNEFVSWNPNFTKYWTEPLPILGAKAGGSYDPTAHMLLLYLAYKAAKNEAEASLFYRNTGEIPPKGYSLTSNFTLSEGEKIYVTTARKQGNTWLQWEDGMVWSKPIPLIGETTSTTGNDTAEYNYIYCLTSLYLIPSVPSITVEEMELASKDGFGYGCDGTLREEKEELQSEIWFDHPLGISAKYPYEWVSVAKEGKYLDAVLWSKFGQNGQDGDGTEYVFFNGTKNNPPILLPPYTGRNGENSTVTRYDVTVDSEFYQSDDFIPDGWHDNPISVTPENNTTYVALRKSKWDKESDKSEWLPFSEPAVWSLYVAPTLLNIKSTEILFGAFSLTNILAACTEDMRKTPSNSAFLANGWSPMLNSDSIPSDAYVWMISAETENGNYVQDANGYYWSSPLRITSIPGLNNTSDVALDDKDINFIFTLASEKVDVPIPTFKVEDIEAEGVDHITLNGFDWFDHPQGVSELYPFEYISINLKGIWSLPSLWSVYGKLGTDGDSVEYIFCALKRAVTNYDNIIDRSMDYVDHNGRKFSEDDFLPRNPQVESGGEYASELEYYRRQFEWTDNPTGISEEFPYLYVSIRKKKDGKWQQFEVPTLWARYGRDGESGTVNGYILHCDNDNVFIDDNFFSVGANNFNIIAGAKFTLESTSGEELPPVVYKIQDLKLLPSYLYPSIDYQGNLSYEVQGSPTLAIKGSYYLSVGAYINDRCVASRKLTIQIDDFTPDGTSYKLSVTPNAIKLTLDGRFTDVNEVEVNVILIGKEVKQIDPSKFTELLLGLRLLKYSSNYEQLSEEAVTSTRVTLGNVNSEAVTYYIFKLILKGVCVDSETVNTYRDGKSPSLSQLLDFEVLRFIGSWAPNTQYYDGHTPDENGIYYKDVVNFAGISYVCATAHISEESFSVEERGNWTEMLHIEDAYVNNIVAKYLTSESISAHQITVLDSSGKICGGLTSSTEVDDSVRLWMGSNLINNAPFKVHANGLLEAENANIKGDIQATSLTVIDGDGTPTIQFKLSTGEEKDLDDNTIYPPGTPIIIITAGQDDLGNPIQYVVNMLRLKGSGDEYLFTPGRIVSADIIDDITGVTLEKQGNINYTLKTIQYVQNLPYLRKLSNGVPYGEYYYPSNANSIVNRIFDYHPSVIYDSPGSNPVTPPFTCHYTGKGYLGAFWIEYIITMEVQENPLSIIPNWTSEITLLLRILYNDTNNIYESLTLRIFLRMTDNLKGTYWLLEITKEVGDLNELITSSNEYNNLRNRVTQLVGPGNYLDAFKVYKYIQILNLKLMNMPTSYMEEVRDSTTPMLLSPIYVYYH